MGNTPLDEKFPIPTADGASHAYTQKVDIEHNGMYSSDQNHIHVYMCYSKTSKHCWISLLRIYVKKWQKTQKCHLN